MYYTHSCLFRFPLFFRRFVRQPVGHDLVFQDILATCGCSTLGAAGGRETPTLAAQAIKPNTGMIPHFL